MPKSRWDAVVVGSGIAGLMTATALATRLDRVLVIEGSSFVGARQSTLTAATVHQRGGHTDDETIAASELFPPMDFISEDALAPVREVVMVYEDGDPRDADLIKRDGVDVTDTLADFLRPEFAAGLRARRVAEIQLDPVKAMASATQAFLANGGAIATGVSVTDFLSENGRIVGVRTNSPSLTEVQTERVVIAAGERTVSLAESAALHVSAKGATALRQYASSIVMRYGSHVVGTAAPWFPNVRCLNMAGSPRPINGIIAVRSGSGKLFISGPHTQPVAPQGTLSPDPSVARAVMASTLAEKQAVLERSVKSGGLRITGAAPITKVESRNAEGRIVQTPAIASADGVTYIVPGKWESGPWAAKLASEAAGIRPDTSRMRVAADLAVSQDALSVVAQPHMRVRDPGPRLITGDGMNVAVQPLSQGLSL